MHQSWLDGQHFPEESKPDVEITGKEPEKIQLPDPEVEPDKKPTPPPTNKPEIPLDQIPKDSKEMTYIVRLNQKPSSIDSSISLSERNFG